MTETMVTFVPGNVLMFTYTNCRGVVEERCILFESISYGFLNGLCQEPDRQAGQRRYFVTRNIHQDTLRIVQ